MSSIVVDRPLGAGAPPSLGLSGGGRDVLPGFLRRHGPRRRYLVVARRGPSGPGLGAALAERAAAGPCSFHVVTLLRPVALAAVLGAAWDPSSGSVGYHDIAEACRQDRAESAMVLDAWTRRFVGLGLEVSGEVAERGPVEAVTQAVAAQGAFMEILVAERRSAVRTAVSRAGGFDLPQRLQRRLKLPTARVDP